MRAFSEFDRNVSFGESVVMQLEEIQKCAMDLPDGDRARLAADLLGSLPAMMVDPDDGIAEARRRSRELAENPSVGCTWEEIRRDLGR
jgi:hypothetical protein